MCSLTDESKQSADLVASRLSGSLCRIFPLCLVKLYHPVLGGNSCRLLPIIHIIENASRTVGGITSSCSVTAWRKRFSFTLFVHKLVKVVEGNLKSLCLIKRQFKGIIRLNQTHIMLHTRKQKPK